MAPGYNHCSTNNTIIITGNMKFSRLSATKGGFFARLFNKKPTSKSADRRSSSGVRKSQTVDSSLPECCEHAVKAHQTNSNQTTKPLSNPSSQQTTPRIGYNGIVAGPPTEQAPPVPVELGTFSAQFPPSEWLHDPRFMQIPEMSHDMIGKQRKKKDVEVGIRLLYSNHKTNPFDKSFS